jgi:hypothetical protein
VRFERRIVRQATRGGDQPSVFDLDLSQAISAFVELFPLSCNLVISFGNLLPGFVALQLEMLALPRFFPQTPPQAPSNHPQGRLEICPNFRP